MQLMLEALPLGRFSGSILLFSRSNHRREESSRGGRRDCSVLSTSALHSLVSWVDNRFFPT
jgi:hypothetical protein